MIPFLLHGIQAGLSAFALYHSSISIPNLQKWESKSEKAAKVSKTAEHDLQKTRKTQTAGVVSSIISVLSALLLALHIVSPGFKAVVMNLVCAAVTAAASVYIGGHWDGKREIPLVTSYNDALTSTKEIRGQLALLGVVWALSSVVELFNWGLR